MDAPEAFEGLAASLRAAVGSTRAEVSLQELPAPNRVAPAAMALGAQLEQGEEELAAGRLVLLYDPAGQPAWDGTTRLVCYGRAVVDAELAADPLLPGVCWSWLDEALAAEGAEHHAIGGTVTVTSSCRFGELKDNEDSGRYEVELRCSWTPHGADLAPHLHAFAEVLCTMAGLPPQASGVVSLPGRRTQ